MKFYEYEAGDVGEYWLIDPDDRRAEFYQLDASGKYQIVLPNADGVYRARVPAGFWLRVDWLWQDPMPSINRVMLDIDGAAYAQRMMDELADSGHAL